MGQLLVIAVDARKTDLTRIKFINLNLVTQSNPPISTDPIRPSFGAGTSSANLAAEQIYFFAWPILLQGDNTATLTVNAIYAPPTPGQPRKDVTLYPPGSIIQTNGHYYLTYEGGLSGASAPTKWENTAIIDNDCQWVSIGSTPPPSALGITPAPYKLGQPYKNMDVVYVLVTGLYYAQAAVPAPPNTTCTSNTSMSTFYVTAGTTSEEAPKADGKTTDGDIQWMDSAIYDTACGGPAATQQPWKSATHYNLGTVVCNPKERGREYVVIASPSPTSKTGNSTPVFSHKDELLYTVAAVTWTDLGQIQPASVTNSPATDQTVALLSSKPLPQTHSLYSYNISSGVVVTSIRVPSYGFVAGSTPSTNSGKAVQTGSTLLIDPVISLTKYIKPFDAERKWQPSDLIPGITLSFSLSSPTSNFYFGGSSEFQRYLQFTYGFAIAKTQQLVSNGYVPSSSSTPATTSVWSKGGYIGLSFNISGLIQGLTSSASGGGKSSSSTSSSSGQ
jgi:hypothetical protein